MEGPHVLCPEPGAWPIGVTLAGPETHQPLQGMEKAFPRPHGLLETESCLGEQSPGDHSPTASA